MEDRSKVKRPRNTLWSLKRKARKRVGIAKDRPCLVVQSNLFSPYGTRAVCTITSCFEKDPKTGMIKNIKDVRDTQVPIAPDKQNGLSEPSLICCDQIHTVSDGDFGKQWGEVDIKIVEKVDAALKLSLGLK